jgi:hypothetical protein
MCAVNYSISKAGKTKVKIEDCTAHIKRAKPLTKAPYRGLKLKESHV